ncbi:MAG TPA: heme A synthase [Flavobacteriales bacterium]|nr:heme A synthase [Flavobacteriales bacterium]HRE73964.1 COX15/CtaA family protein [Flavobacteriales bacterium]
MIKRFSILTKLTLIAVLLVVLAGSVVRMSGSGMGCPDWPRCFGQWIPPTDISQLPADYKEVYAAKRAKKLEDFCRLLDRTGFSQEATAMRSDSSLLEEQDFNATKTWTEYINRLIGFVSGNLMLVQFILSLWWWKTDKRLIFFCLLNLILLAVTAWFGAIVVATNLLPWVLTVHMVLALLIIVLQVVIIERASMQKEKIQVPKTIRVLLGLVIVIGLLQILMGTQIRQQIDALYAQFGGEDRHLWIDQLTTIFYIHRSFSWMIVLLTIFIWYKLRESSVELPGIKFLFSVIAIEVVSGATLAYFNMPALIQPLHLLLACMMIIVQMRMFLQTQS